MSKTASHYDLKVVEGAESVTVGELFDMFFAGQARETVSFQPKPKNFNQKVVSFCLKADCEIHLDGRLIGCALRQGEAVTIYTPKTGIFSTTLTSLAEFDDPMLRRVADYYQGQTDLPDDPPHSAKK